MADNNVSSCSNESSLSSDSEVPLEVATTALSNVSDENKKML